MQGIAQKILANPGKYSIQQLRQGVENGIIPAYIAVPLIQEKVQQEKQMQMAQSMQQGPAQNQQTIADQVMQEAQGVASLSTRLPTQYAAGGIVAFEEGGPVERYQNTGLVGVNPLTQRRPGESFEDFRRRVLELDAQARQEQQAQETQAREAERQRLLAQRGPMFTSPFVAPAAVTPTRAATPATAADLGPVPGTSDSTPVLGGTPTTTRAAGPKPAPLDRVPTTRADDSGIGIGGVSALGRGPGVGLKAPTLTAPEGSSYETMAKNFFNQYGQQATERDTALDEKVNAEREKVKGQAFEDYKKTLQKEAIDAGADKSQAKYMSMFKAGLAMMAGTSRNALENIGKGAMVGAEDYQAAVKDLKKAERERAKELANIEQARRAEALGDRDTAIKRLDSARDRADARARYVGEGIYKATGLDKNQAFDLAKTQFSSDSDIFRTNLAGQYQLAGQRIGAEATVAAANARAARGEGITPYQLARLRSDAEKQVDPAAIRAQVAQQLKLSKPPKPGADQTFEQRFQQAYAAAIDDRVNRNLGYGFGGAGTSGGQGFQLPQGYKLLGPE